MARTAMQRTRAAENIEAFNEKQHERRDTEAAARAAEVTRVNIRLLKPIMGPRDLAPNGAGPGTVFNGVAASLAATLVASGHAEIVG